MKNKILKIIIKALIVVGIIGAIAGISYLILYFCGFTTLEDFTRLRDTLGDTFGFWAIITALQVFQVVFLPITNQIITVPIAILFNNELWKVFLSSWVGIFIGTIILFFIGRFGGDKLLSWVLSNKESAKKCEEWLKQGKAFYVSAMLIPWIPDDVITTIVGTSKYNFWFVLVVSAITRGICTAFSVWGFGYLTQFWWGWIILFVGLIALLGATFLIWKWQQKRIKQRKLMESAIDEMFANEEAMYRGFDK